MSRSLGEVALPVYNSGDAFSTVQKKCADYAAARAVDDFKRTGVVVTLSTVQAYTDECGRAIESQRQERQIMVFGAILAGSGALWWLWAHR